MRRESVRGDKMDQQYGNVELLFETRPVAEIEEIVKKLEKEIEMKRSDLRQVVGEKYKDLVEVSNNLIIMADRCNHLLGLLNSLDEFSKEYKNDPRCDKTLGIESTKRSTSAQQSAEWLENIKSRIIVRTPSLIWSAMDKNDMLTATYLFAHGLDLWKSLKSQDFKSTDTVLRYADLISSLKESLIHHSWESMKFSGNSDNNNEKIAQELICASFLQECGPTNLLTQFLDQRRQQICSFDHSKHNLSENLEFMIGNIVDTCQTVFLVFMEDGGVPSLLQRTSLYVLRFKPGKDIFTRLSSLSDSIGENFNFFLKLDHMDKDITPSNVAKICYEWAIESKKDIVYKIRKSLETVRGVDLVFSSLGNLQKLVTNSDKLINWEDLNETFFNNELHIWNFYLKEVVINFLNQVITNRLEDSFAALQKKVMFAIPQMNHQSALDWVWSDESSDDLFKKSFRVYDEYINMLSIFESELENLRGQFSFIQREHKNLAMIPEGDLKDLKKCFNDLLLENVEILLTTLKASLDQSDYFLSLGLADLHRTLIFASPQFKACHTFLGDSTLWPKSRSLLQEAYSTAISAYLQGNLANLIETFRGEMKVTPLINLLNICSTWNEINLEDSSESGEIIQSTLRLPMQISSPLFRLLNSMNEALNQQSAHTMSSTILKTILGKMISELRTVYGQLLDAIKESDSPSSVKQTQILQFVFDISFIHKSLKSMDDSSIGSDLMPLLITLEQEYRSQIDPVDLHALEPHFQSALSKCLTNNFLLFGCLFVDLGLSHTNISEDSPVNEPHILMPCYQFNSKFSLLPLKRTGK
ncbi:conserved oligomeric Golgi complex subunit 1 [Brevipalpus obovatus]|uniref:conserved oligomeric Golgi complex subunit 1 n=1 Tax=Brevipalpus obovatus TaxID=246614 RepID=UPI003D9E9E5E